MPTLRHKRPQPKILRLSRRRRNAEFERVDLRDLLPVVGSITRSKKLIKSVLRADRLLKAQKMPAPKRLMANTMIGADSLLQTGKLKPGGAVLYGIDRTGKAMVKGFRRKGLAGAAQGLSVGARHAAGNIKRSTARIASPVTTLVGKSRRAYKLMPEEMTRRQRITASLKVGVSQLLKKNKRKGVGQKLYNTDRAGRNTVRRVRRWRRRSRKG